MSLFHTDHKTYLTIQERMVMVVDQEMLQSFPESNREFLFDFTNDTYVRARPPNFCCKQHELQISNGYIYVF